MRCQRLNRVRGHPCRRATPHWMSRSEEDEEERTQSKFWCKDSENEPSEECVPEEDSLVWDIRGWEGQEGYPGKWDSLLWAIRIQKVKEGVHGKGQPHMSCWSTSRLNRVSVPKGGWPWVESQSLSKLRKVSKWKGCVMWGFEAQESWEEHLCGGW